MIALAARSKTLVLLVAAAALSACSSSSGGGGSRPAKTYIVLPSGVAVPATNVPPPSN